MSLDVPDDVYYPDAIHYSGAGVRASQSLAIPDKVAAAIDAAVDARGKIPTLQEELRDLVTSADSETARDAFLYQTDLIGWQINRAADLAEYRHKHLSTIKTQARAKDELVRVEKDVGHYFKTYAWGFDPRPDAPIAVVPFELFEFQKRFVDWLDHLVFVKRTSGVVEKARDMGATETALRWTLHKWRFMPGFSAILLSATEDLVDSKKNENTLFEKIRYQLRMFPEWLLPKDFDLNRDMPYMNIANPAINSALHGYAPTANVGRQSRATVVLKDEEAAWPHGGFPQHAALGSTSKSLIGISSVQGKGNNFADQCLNGRTAKFVMDWREHPWKDDRWYKSLQYGYISATMTEQQIAQEIDRNFDASQPGKVFTNLKEEYCFITWKELVEFYQQYKLDVHFKGENDQVKVPIDWNWGRAFDYGQTDGHKWGYSILARPPESWPLFDSVFIFCAQPMPQAGTTAQQFVSHIEQWETALGLRNGKTFPNYPQYSECSHEQNDLRDTLLTVYGESWTAWDTDYVSGIAQIQEWFSVIDTAKPNPFRPQLNGRATIYFVAPDSEYTCVYNDREGKHFVTPSITEWGFKLLRAELSEYHYPPEERFKPLPAQRPKKIKDDVIDTIRGHATHWGSISKGLTQAEKYRRRLKAMVPASLAAKMDGIPANGNGHNGNGSLEIDSGVAIDEQLTLQMAEARLKKELRQEGGFVPSGPFDQEPDEYGYESDGDGW